MMEQKSLNTLIDVDGTWQRSKAHFFPIFGLGFCLPPNYLSSVSKISKSLYGVGTMRTCTRIVKYISFAIIL